MIWKKSSVALTIKDMKNASINLRNLEITDEVLNQMRSSLLAVDQHNQLDSVYKYDDLITGKLVKEFNYHAENFNNVYQRADYLINKRHFFDHTAYYTEQEASDAKNEFYIIIPERCQELRKELAEFKERIKPLYRVFNKHYKYAFFLDKNFNEEYEHMDKYLSDLVNQAQNMIEIILNLEELIGNQEIPSCFSCEANIKGQVTYNKLLATNLHSFLSWIDDNNQNIYKVDQLSTFAEWIDSNRGMLVGLCERGFFRIDNKFVHYFLEQKEIRWGGFFKNRNDWMHFEIGNKYRKF